MTKWSLFNDRQRTVSYKSWFRSLVVLKQTLVMIIIEIVRVIVLFMSKVEIFSTTNDKVETFQQQTKESHLRELVPPPDNIPGNIC